MKKIFIRQGFTQSTPVEQTIIQEVIDIIGTVANKLDLQIIGNTVALNKDNFKQQFTTDYNLEFTPHNFRTVRLRQLGSADYFIIIRTGLSESSSFEVAYNIFGGKNIPMLFLIWDKAPIKTTLLRELDDIAKCSYLTFKNADEITAPLRDFFQDRT